MQPVSTFRRHLTRNVCQLRDKTEAVAGGLDNVAKGGDSWCAAAASDVGDEGLAHAYAVGQLSLGLGVDPAFFTVVYLLLSTAIIAEKVGYSN